MPITNEERAREAAPWLFTNVPEGPGSLTQQQQLNTIINQLGASQQPGAPAGSTSPVPTTPKEMLAGLGTGTMETTGLDNWYKGLGLTNASAQDMTPSEKALYQNLDTENAKKISTQNAYGHNAITDEQFRQYYLSPEGTPGDIFGIENPYGWVKPGLRQYVQDDPTKETGYQRALRLGLANNWTDYDQNFLRINPEKKDTLAAFSEENLPSIVKAATILGSLGAGMYASTPAIALENAAPTAIEGGLSASQVALGTGAPAYMASPAGGGIALNMLEAGAVPAAVSSLPAVNAAVPHAGEALGAAPTTAGGIPIAPETAGAVAAGAAVPAAAPAAAPAATTQASTSIIPETIMGIDTKTLGSGALMLGGNLLNSNAQASQLSDVNAANLQAYEQYLSGLNLTEDEKRALYNQLVGNIKANANKAREQIQSTLGSRGIRGKGRAAPTAQFETDVVMPALNQAYNQVYSDRNIPTVLPPTNYSPSAQDLLAGNIGNTANWLGSVWLGKQLFG